MIIHSPYLGGFIKLSHINRRHSEIVTILNTAFICLVVLCILCMSIDMASASSSYNKGNSGRKPNDHNQQPPKVQPTANASPHPTDTATGTPAPSPTPDITAAPRQEPEPIRTIDMSSIYGTPIPILSGTNNNTTQIAPVNETANSTIMNSTNADSYNVTSDNKSSVMPDTVSGQQGGPSSNWLALTIITIPAILAALVVVVQFVRKIE